MLFRLIQFLVQKLHCVYSLGRQLAAKIIKVSIYTQKGSGISNGFLSTESKILLVREIFLNKNLLLLQPFTGATMGTGGSSARLEYLVWDQGVAGSNPVLPTLTKIKFYQNLQNQSFEGFFMHISYQKTRKKIKTLVSYPVSQNSMWIGLIFNPHLKSGELF